MSQMTSQRGRRRSGKLRTPAWTNTAYPDFAGLFKRGLSRLRLSPTWALCVPLALIILATWNIPALAQDAPALEGAELTQAVLDNIWILIAGVLVVFMNAGFGMLETGFCRQKNAVNILSKNLLVFGLATLAYWAIGYGLMYGEGGGGFAGFGNFFLSGLDLISPADPAGGNYLTPAVDFFFQAAFAATAATIVSGAVAERIKFVDFIIFSLFLTAVVYPISGHWLWGGGMLSDIGFLTTDPENPVGFSDFAGSTVVHSAGGWAALVGASFLGPRLGKYREDGGAGALPGHNMSIAMLGCLILWIGWFGFNPGSELAANLNVPYIALTTNLAAAAGCVAATATSWALSGKPDLSMIINGVLAGLVGITAGCNNVSPLSAVIIGLIAGVLVVFSVFFFDSIKIDDPVGATSVHLVNGIWGTLAVGLFDRDAGLLTGHSVTQLIAQIIGVLTIGGWVVLMSVIGWGVIRAVLGMRVSEEEELIGLDISEHGMEAYSGFSTDSGSGVGATLHS